MYFDILNDLGVAHECDRHTDGQRDRQTEQPLAIARSRPNIVKRVKMHRSFKFYWYMPAVFVCVLLLGSTCWTVYYHSRMFDGQPDRSSTLADCQSHCIGHPSCAGVDWHSRGPSRYPQFRCWLQDSWSSRSQRGSSVDVIRYNLIRNCAWEVKCNCDVGFTGEFRGSGDHAMPHTFPSKLFREKI